MTEEERASQVVAVMSEMKSHRNRSMETVIVAPGQAGWLQWRHQVHLALLFLNYRLSFKTRD